MSNGCDDADNQELIELEYAIGKARDNGAQNLENDDDKEDVIDALDHSIGKEGGCLYEALDAEEEGSDADGEECDCKDCVKDIFNEIYIFQRQDGCFDPLGFLISHA